VPIIFRHGTADKLVPFAGGKIIPNGFRDRGSVLSDATTANFWQKRNNCGTAQVETLPDVAGDGTIVQIATYACPPGSGLINIIIEGGGHTWPGARQGIIADRILGTATHNLDANETMWRFFNAQSSAVERK
jgi:polyhydroxybutyrate depolymerase